MAKGKTGVTLKGLRKKIKDAEKKGVDAAELKR